MLYQDGQEASGSAVKTKVDREREGGREGKRWERDVVCTWEIRMFGGQKPSEGNKICRKYIMNVNVGECASARIGMCCNFYLWFN